MRHGARSVPVAARFPVGNAAAFGGLTRVFNELVLQATDKLGARYRINVAVQASSRARGGVRGGADVRSPR